MTSFSARSPHGVLSAGVRTPSSDSWLPAGLWCLIVGNSFEASARQGFRDTIEIRSGVRIQRREFIMVGEYGEGSGLGNENEVDRVAESGVENRFYLVLSLSRDRPTVSVLRGNGVTAKQADQVRGFEDDLIHGETT